MTKASIDDALPLGDRLLLDSTVLIAYLDGSEPTSGLAAHIIDELVRPGRNEAIISMVTIMEVLVRPLRRGPGKEYRQVMDFLSSFPNLYALPIDLAVAQKAASLRATYGFRSPDALVIASGVVAPVGHLVTNDAEWPKRLQPISSIKVCLLQDCLPFP